MEAERQARTTATETGVSRRRFLKGALAATTAAAVVAPGGLAMAKSAPSSSSSPFGQPFWVKQLDGRKVEIDDSVLTRFDNNNSAFRTGRAAWTAEETAQIQQINEDTVQGGITRGDPGYDLKSHALLTGGSALRGNAGTMYSWTSIGAKHPRDAYGVEPWSGDPEEAARMVKAAGVYYGAGSVGIAELDRRWIYAVDGAPIEFADVDQPAIEMTEPDEQGKTRIARKVIPNKCKYVIAMTIPMSYDLMALAPTIMEEAATMFGYSLMPFVSGSLAEFIRALGYTAIPCGNDTGLSVPVAIDAGLGELSRTGRLITPAWGMNVRICKVITDFPMATDKPIDFGATEFCRTCKKCAENCMGQALSMETDRSWEVTGPWNQPGKKVWYVNASNCMKGWSMTGTDCGICIRVCPYTKKGATSMHTVVKGTIATLPFLNGTVTALDNFFGYGEFKDPEEWWKSLHASFARDGIL